MLLWLGFIALSAFYLLGTLVAWLVSRAGHERLAYRLWWVAALGVIATCMTMIYLGEA